MSSSQLRTSSYVAGCAAIFGVLLAILAIVDGTSLTSAASLTLTGTVLFFFLRHFANRDAD